MDRFEMTKNLLKKSYKQAAANTDRFERNLRDAGLPTHYAKALRQIQKRSLKNSLAAQDFCRELYNKRKK